MSSSVPISRLVKRAEFVRVASAGQKIVTHSVVLQASTGEGQTARYGITATKTLGNAVIRNRAKRRMRAAVRDILPAHGMVGIDYVLIGRKLCVQTPYESLCRDLIYAVKKVNKACAALQDH